MKISNPFSKLNRRVGIDLGSSQTRIWVQDYGLVVDEPSLIAIDESSKKVLAVGKKAQSMQERVSDEIKVYSPVQHPKLMDDGLIKAMLKVFFKQMSPEVYFFSPTMMVALPSNIFPSMKQIVVEILTELGASEVAAVEQTIAAAIGSGVPIAEPAGTFVLQMGASVTEAAAFSMGKTVKNFAINHGGWQLEQEIQYWFKEQKQLKVGRAASRKVMQELMSLNNEKSDQNRALTVAGINLETGELTDEKIYAEEVFSLAQNYGQNCVQLVKKLLAVAPPSLVVDVVDRGILLSGGLSQLKGLDDYLSSQLEFLAFVVDKPETSVIRGVGLILDHFDEFKQSLGY